LTRHIEKGDKKELGKRLSRKRKKNSKILTQTAGAGAKTRTCKKKGSKTASLTTGEGGETNNTPKRGRKGRVTSSF